MVISLLPERKWGGGCGEFLPMQRTDRGSIVTAMPSQCTIGRQWRAETGQYLLVDFK